MKVLLVNDYGAATGGAEHQILSLRAALRARGHDARLFASTAMYSPGQPDADYYCSGSIGRLQPLLMVANYSAARQLRRVLASFRPDVVHLGMFLWQLSPLVLPLLKRFPCVHHVQMYNEVCPLGTKMTPDGKLCEQRSGLACLQNGCLTPQSWMLRMTQKALWKRSRNMIDYTAAVSEAVRRRLEEDGIHVEEVVWNGVPVTDCPQMLSNLPTAVFAGRLDPEKGVDILLRAFALVRTSVPAARLIVAGEGMERVRLEQLRNELGLDDAVKMLGFRPRDMMEQEFRGAWVQVVPGRWEEPFGLVIAEAMMRRTAVVASALGGALEQVADGITGFLVPPNDTRALSESLISVLSNPETASLMGNAGRERALRDFTEETLVKRFLAIYEKLLRAPQVSKA